MAYDNTNSGLLAKNDRKEKDSHPDYRGKINVEGKDYWLSGWLKVGSEGSKLAGQKFFSLAVTPIEDEKPKPRATATPSRQDQRGRSRIEEMEDDIPF
jgi:hypothetical protein